MITNISNTFKSCSSTSGGEQLSLVKTSEAQSHTCHVCQADFYPFPLNAETTSQPVNANLFWGKCQEKLLYWYPLQMSSLSKSKPHFLKEKLLQVWEGTHCNYQNICVIGFNYNRFDALLYSMILVSASS